MFVLAISFETPVADQGLHFSNVTSQRYFSPSFILHSTASVRSDLMYPRRGSFIRHLRSIRLRRPSAILEGTGIDIIFFGWITDQKQNQR